MAPTTNLEKWEAEVAAEIENPSADVNVSGGLVQGVEGSEVGKLTYTHEGEMLTAVDGPKGETEYSYDSGERLSKVSLPNGTWGEIKYDEFGRANSVTVSVEGGASKTTKFEYTDSPSRSTRVVPDGEVATNYVFGVDGSLLKWSNGKTPPIFDDISGTLHDPEDLETTKAISPGVHNLVVQAFSAEGIKSIEVIANGSDLVKEKTCEENLEKVGVECEIVKTEWVTETGNWPPGILLSRSGCDQQLRPRSQRKILGEHPLHAPTGSRSRGTRDLCRHS
jgi:hypothetical protein